MEKDFISTLKQRLQTPKKAVIIPHKNPDGDALGSTLAWMHFLQNENHEALIISPNDYPKFLNWLPGQEQILIYNQKKELIATGIATLNAYPYEKSDMNFK